jgi:hypothetical protein
MKELILEYNKRIKDNLDHINENCIPNQFYFRTGELVPYSGQHSEDKCSAWQRLGQRFREVKSPVVYWFEMNKEIDPVAVFTVAKKCKNSQNLDDINFRHLPSMHENCPTISNILYVGCCGSTSLMDRMFWHFGYYRTGKTQGLQLCHWSRGLNLELAIHTLSFPDEAKDFIYVYEKQIAQKLKPIIGK